jgi:maltose O-acetyltransferase
MRERMLAGELYIADDPDLAREAARARTLTHRINAMDPNDSSGRRAVLEDLLGAFGAGSELLPPFRCDYGSQTTVGDRVFANFGLVCLDVARVTIGVAVGNPARVVKHLAT